VPADSKIASRFANTHLTCSAKDLSASLSPAGVIGRRPEIVTKPFATAAWLYRE